MTVLLILVLYLLALAGCGWLFWQSVKLIIHGFQRAFGSSFVPTFGIDGPTMPRPSVQNPSPVPGLTAQMIGNHIGHCQVCRESYVTGTLPLLLPETLTRIVGICEAEDAVAVNPST
jgi:hypothetical protein